MPTYFGGSSHAAGDADFNAADLKAVNISTCPATGSITTARVWADGLGTGTYKFRFIVYSVSGGTPDTLLGSSDEVTVTNGAAEGLFTCPFSTPVAVTNGTDYALGIH